MPTPAPLERLPWRVWWTAIAVALLVSVAAPAAPADTPALAFIGIWNGIVLAAGWLWKVGSTAVTAAVKYAIVGLQWAVTNLTRLIVAGLKKTAVFLARTAKATWRLIQRGLQATLKALDKALTWLKRTLDHVFGPVLEFLGTLKKHVYDFYKKWVRPILDAIEITRRVFQVLGWFGLDWAKAIDAKLARISDLISYPFDWVVGKINEVIGIVNRIVTVDGLLQRIVLLNSLIRDYPQTMNLWWNGFGRPLTALESANYARKPKRVPAETALTDLRQHVETGDADVSPVINEIVQSIKLNLGRRGR